MPGFPRSTGSRQRHRFMTLPSEERVTISTFSVTGWLGKIYTVSCARLFWRLTKFFKNCAHPRFFRSGLDESKKIEQVKKQWCDALWIVLSKASASDQTYPTVHWIMEIQLSRIILFHGSLRDGVRKTSFGDCSLRIYGSVKWLIWPRQLRLDGITLCRTVQSTQSRRQFICNVTVGESFVTSYLDLNLVLNRCAVFTRA